MTSSRKIRSVSRRAALAGLGAGSLGLAARVPGAGAQDAATQGHPIVGTWYSLTPLGPALSIYGTDGALTVVFAPTQAGPQAVTYHSASLGSWEPTDDRAIRFI
jgi:hypothetical protein